jgi:hypothetical protein
MYQTAHQNLKDQVGHFFRSSISYNLIIYCAVFVNCQSDKMSTANHRENILSLGK